jgi:hypothetical protein
MSFRDHASSIMDNLIATGIWTAAILTVKFWPRIVALPSLLVRRFRARSGGGIIVTPLTGSIIVKPLTGSIVIDVISNPPLPPGTPSATVMATQPPIERPTMPSTFVNNSHVMQWHAAQHHRETGMLMAMRAYEEELERTRFAMRTTMPQFNHAL